MAIRIERLMEERNLRAAHVAEELDVGRDYVGRWLKGGGIRDDHLDALASFFGTTPAWVVTGTGPMHPEFKPTVDVDHDDVDAMMEQQAREELEARDREVPQQGRRRRHG